MHVFLTRWLVILGFSITYTVIAYGEESSPGKISWLNKVEGSAEILVEQARQYEHGENMPQDREKARELYCQAAQQGSADGQYALGWMYANGRGVERDDSIAATLFEMAADRNHAGAQKLLQFMRVPDKHQAQLPNCLNRNAYAPTNTLPGKYYVDQSVSALVEKLAPHYQIDPGLVLAVISVESGFNVQAVSSKNAQGLMQLIPATAERFQVRDVFDPEENIRGGMAYLRWLLAFFKGDVALVAAAYNAGEGAVEKYRGIPPYPETVNYVDKILARYNKATHPYQPDAVSRTSFIFTTAATGE